MSKKNIIGFVAAFSIVAILIYTSSLIFGHNSRIAVMVGVLTLFIIFMMDNDEMLYKSILKMIGIILPSIIFGFIAKFNIFLELTINLVWISGLIYLTLKYLKIQMYLPALFIYIISLNFGTNINMIVPSYVAVLIAIIVGAVVKIILSKLLINKKEMVSVYEFIQGFKVFEHFITNTEIIIFAVKTSIMLSVVMFIINIINLAYGEWILLVVITMLYPYKELSVQINKDIVIGSVMGAIRLLIVVTIVPLYAVRMGIMGMGVYYFLSSKKPRVRAMGAMMFGLSMTEVGTYFNGVNIEELIQRAIFVAIGIVLSILVSKVFEILLKIKALKEAF